MKGIWLMLVPERIRQMFFQQSLLEWIYTNLGLGGEVNESPWSPMLQWLYGGGGNGGAIMFSVRIDRVGTESGLLKSWLKRLCWLIQTRGT